MNSSTLTLTDRDEYRERMRTEPVFRAALQRQWWYSGELDFVLRPYGQTALWEFLHSLEESTSPIFLKCHRRLGKSFEGLAVALARCLKYPMHLAKFAAPTREQAHSIAIPNLQILLQSCPKELRPKVKGHTYYFRNPAWGDEDAFSTLEIHGANWKRGDPMRGLACDTWVLDEIRDFDHLEYLIEDVISYQFAGRKHPLLLMLSTPPRNIDHASISVFQKRARAEGRYACVKASQNPDWTADDENAVLKIVGSKKTIGWRREAECEDIADPDDLIVPEWQEVADYCVEERKRPSYFNCYTCMDTGWQDFTAVGFWYVDFKEQCFVLDDEIFVHNVTTGDLAQRVLAKEEALWGDHLAKRRGKLRRYADATPQQINDLRLDHGLQLAPVEKHDREGQTIATFRTTVGAGQVRVHPRCEEHIYQFQFGVWDERRRTFIRSERLGHCDCIDEAAYLVRSASLRRNPFPAKGYDPLNKIKRAAPQEAEDSAVGSLLGSF